MTPVLYDKISVSFSSGRIARLSDCVSCLITEERNGVFEIEFSYPVEGVNFDKIEIGQIVAAAINDSGELQMFDIISASKPINGLVTFFGSHVSYRLNKITTSGTNINSLSAALTMLENGTPENPFSFEADFEVSGYMASADGTPRTIRSMLGGVEGSILDTYGGEFEFDNWTVKLHETRGRKQTFPIRYGVNLVDYKEEFDTSETFTGVVPFWKNDVEIVTGPVVDSGMSTLSERTEIVPLDCSDKFEEPPTTTELQNYAESFLSSNKPHLPKQTIELDFVNLADTLEYQNIAPLLDYRICDNVPVEFPMYGTEAEFKIVKTVYDVLAERYTSMELGQLATTLSEALGLSSSFGDGGVGGLEVKSFNYDKFTYASGFAAYSTASGSVETPTAKKWGGVVSIYGAFKKVNAQSGTANILMGKVPPECNPSQQIKVLQQGSGAARWFMTINTDGTMYADRYGTTSQTAIPNNAWLNIGVTYVI